MTPAELDALIARLVMGAGLANRMMYMFGERPTGGYWLRRWHWNGKRRRRGR